MTGQHLAAARVTTAAVTTITVVLLSGCAHPVDIRPRRAASTVPDATVIDFSGTDGVRWGQTLDDLRDTGVMAPSPDGCGPRFVGIEGAGPVFEEDRLGVDLGLPTAAHARGRDGGHPDARRACRVPAGNGIAVCPGLFDALLVANGRGQAYLILHDDEIVQKLIVGLESAARRLYASRLDTC